MSKKTTGVQDLANTLVKQHGLENAYWIARNATKTKNDGKIHTDWKSVSQLLSLQRNGY